MSIVKTIALLGSAFGLANAALSAPGYLEETVQEAETAICDSVKQYSGYYKLTTGDKNYFYWAFESRNNPKTDPVVLCK